MSNSVAEIAKAASALGLLAISMLLAASAAQAREAPVEPPREVAQLPFARGHSFASLDAYLAYLEQANGPIDLPWWRRIGPGLYEHVVRMPGAKPERATRDELLRRFGFAR